MCRLDSFWVTIAPHFLQGSVGVHHFLDVLILSPRCYPLPNQQGCSYDGIDKLRVVHLSITSPTGTLDVTDKINTEFLVCAKGVPFQLMQHESLVFFMARCWQHLTIRAEWSDLTLFTCLVSRAVKKSASPGARVALKSPHTNNM